MTIETTVNKTIQSGNGSNKDFDFAFEIPDEDSLSLTKRNSDGTETAITSNYTVTGIGDEAGGSVNYPTSGSALTSSEKIIIKRVVALKQLENLRNQGDYSLEDIEDALDYAVMICQQLSEEISRCIKLNVTSSQSDKLLDDLIANRLLYVNSDATKIRMSSIDYGSIDAYLSTLVAIADDISAVAAIDTEVTTVAGIETEILAVDANEANINIVAGIDTEITTVAGIAANITSVAGNATNINTVAGIAAAVTSVAAIAANVSTVAGIAANVTTVAGMSASIASVVANMTSIQNAASFGFPTLVSGNVGKTIRIKSTYDGYEVIDLFSNRNLLINPQGMVSQQATTITSTSVPANSDDTYILDVINQVSDGNDICDYSQELTEVPVGSPMSIKCDQETANKQWGLVWFLPAEDAAKVIGGVASLQFKAKKGGSNATLGKLRAAIISWSGTKDSITSDVVGTWAGAGTNPTLASNWTYENIPSDLTLTTSFQTFKIENVAIDTVSAKNVGVFIWLDDTNATVADLAYIADVQLEQGNVCTPFDCRPISLEKIVVRHLFETHEGNSISFIGFTGSFEGTTRGNVQIPFFPKRITPTLSSSAAGTFRVAQGTSNAQGTSIIDLSWQPQINCASLDVQTGGSFTNGAASRITGYDSTLTYVRADARL